MKTKTLPLQNLMNASRSCAFLLIPLAFACFALSPQARGQLSPPPDGCYSNFTTAEGCEALNSLTIGSGNTALGWRSLFSASIASFNTGVGAGALLLNGDGDSNTAIGAGALLPSSAGTQNTAVGTDAMVYNDTGNANTAVGDQALFNNTDGTSNTALGFAALYSNITGNANIAIGMGAGFLQTTGSDNIYIGNSVNAVTGESGACYIANIFDQTVANGIPVLVQGGNKLGTTTSSRRFKKDIRPLENASQILFLLKPVAFRYKAEIDPAGVAQFGLVAEDVEKVNRNLVIRDKEGKPYSVRYDQVNAMLLNEFLKQHKAFTEEQRKVEEQEARITQLKAELQATATRQQKQIEALTAGLQKVSAQIGASKTAPQIVSNNP